MGLSSGKALIVISNSLLLLIYSSEMLLINWAPSALVMTNSSAGSFSTSFYSKSILTMFLRLWFAELKNDVHPMAVANVRKYLKVRKFEP